ncbi:MULTISPECIES: PspC domain-containing protein [Aedoeadaptatus]|uniref:PspC domain-containing protein n=1 Tax=Aedoeadaptatus acetigenes TaxID=2981723 RepID=A0ABV1J6E2_9FIRM|nr:PspC domain-containing protein [Peptoniphilus coli]
MKKELRRSTTDRVFAGVCGGLGEYFDIDSNIVRVLWVLFALGGGSGLLVYIICALLIPEESTW